MSAKSQQRRGPLSPHPDARDLDARDLGAHDLDARELLASYGQPIAEATDPLQAELLAAAMFALVRQETPDAVLAELVTAALIELAGEEPSPESAALLRALAAVAPPHQRRLAVAALGEATAAGYYPPEWAAQVGRAIPGEAWRRHDVFGDGDTVVVTFRYGEDAHAIVVQVDRCQQGVLAATLVMDMARLSELIEGDDDPVQRVERIELAEARARLEAALAGVLDPDEDDERDQATQVALPIARSRIRRLPKPAPAPVRYYRAEDRAAAVTEFLASPQAAGAGGEKLARFWAEVLAGYSATVPGEPPARIGPLKLTHLLRFYVPAVFVLTDEQRRGMPAAVTAWTQWAADRQALDGAARAVLAERLDSLLAGFDQAYADPDAVWARGYLADVAATTTDGQVLAEALRRRVLAVPTPDDRAGDDLRTLDATDPAARRTIVEDELSGCEPPPGMSGPDFVAAAVRVCEQLWLDDPPEVWQRARQLSEDGLPNHEVIHRLAAGP